MEHFNDLGRIGIGSRLKRISDTLISEVNALYRSEGIQLEASCFPLLTLVELYGPLSLREAEGHLGTSHAAVSQKAAILLKAGFIHLQTYKGDHRIKKMTLTHEGQTLMTRARPYWEAMDRAMAQLLYPDENVFFRMLRQFEEKLEARPFREVAMEHLNPPDVEDIKIVDFGMGMKHHFRSLNEEWISKHFKLTPDEEEMFENPRKAILDKGGDILFAESGGDVVGTCALYPHGTDLELIKMSVDPRFRGRGVGRKLLEAAIERAKARPDMQTLYLLSSTKLKSALGMYRALGFRDVPLLPENSAKYGRVDVRMEMRLRD